ncbi:MAG: hypothetical protein LVQ95_01490 [Candidatus Micrarchaeales archaeon]|nr:hypothetical protein [Candidatus Micrarchaeales archaeon]
MADSGKMSIGLFGKLGASRVYLLLAVASFMIFNAIAVASASAAFTFTVDGSTGPVTFPTFVGSYTLAVSGGTPGGTANFIACAVPNLQDQSCGSGNTFILGSSGSDSYSANFNVGSPCITLFEGAQDLSSGTYSNIVQVNFGAACPSSSGGSSGISANGIVAVVCGVYYAVSTMIFLLGLTIGVLIAVIAPYVLSVITGNAALTSVCV